MISVDLHDLLRVAAAAKDTVKELQTIFFQLELVPNKFLCYLSHFKPFDQKLHLHSNYGLLKLTFPLTNLTATKITFLEVLAEIESS